MNKVTELEREVAQLRRNLRAYRHRSRFYKERWLKAAGLVEVEGYTRADGTEVSEHYRRVAR
jgi:hypothetical protein